MNNSLFKQVDGVNCKGFAATAHVRKKSRVPKKQAINMNAKGVTQSNVTVALTLSESTIRRAKRNLKEYSDVEGGKRKCQSILRTHSHFIRTKLDKW
jgi:hypothetical protein